MGIRLKYGMAMVCGIMSMSLAIFAQMTVAPQLPSGILTNGYQSQSRSDRAITEMQAALIYNIFTKEIFATSPLFDEEDEEDQMFSNQQSKTFINELMARTLAEDLARNDMLKLKAQMQKQMAAGRLYQAGDSAGD